MKKIVSKGERELARMEKQAAINVMKQEVEKVQKKEKMRQDKMREEIAGQIAYWLEKEEERRRELREQQKHLEDDMKEVQHRQMLEDSMQSLIQEYNDEEPANLGDFVREYF